MYHNHREIYLYMEIADKQFVAELLLEETVYHKKYGEGIVCDVIIDDQRLDISFQDCEKLFKVDAIENGFLKLVSNTYYTKLEEYKNRQKKEEYALEYLKAIYAEAQEKKRKYDQKIKEELRIQDRKKILQEMAKRNIKYFVHFTSLRNLDSILSQGLMSRKNILNKGIDADFNDNSRLDNHLDAISFSLSSIDGPLNYVFAQKYPDRQWVVLYFNAEKIVSSKDVAFFPGNAANHELRVIPWEDLTGYNALCNLLEYTMGPDSNVTIMQTEIMVKDLVEADYIEKIKFYNKQLLDEYRTIYPEMEDVFGYIPAR